MALDCLYSASLDYVQGCLEASEAEKSLDHTTKSVPSLSRVEMSMITKYLSQITTRITIICAENTPIPVQQNFMNLNAIEIK